MSKMLARELSQEINLNVNPTDIIKDGVIFALIGLAVSKVKDHIEDNLE
jgi:hypothetical protein